MRLNATELEAIVRDRICRVCSDRKLDATCGLEDPGRCTLFSLFPLVAQAIVATSSDKIEDYVHAIRENVCSVCIEQRLDGTCEQREQARCALDAYMVLVVEIIEEATGKQFDRSRIVASKTVTPAPNP